MSNEHLSPPELLDAYLDGELNDTQTHGLFGLLAQSPELQAEMREQLSIRNAIQSASFQVPEHLMQDVLLQTGLATATVQGTAGVIPSLIGRIAGSRLFIVLCSSVISCAATAWYVRNHTTPMPATTASKHTEQVQPVEKHTEPLVQSISAASIQPMALPVKHREHVNQRIEKSDLTKESNPATVSLSDVSLHSEPLSLSSMAQANETLFPIDAVDSPSTLLENKPVGISLNLRGFSSHTFTPTDLPSFGASTLMNMSAGVFYQLSENFSIGAEVGRESFIQEYDGVENGYNVHYEQNYPATWMALGGQYTPGISLLGANPFLRVLAGETKTGPMGRMMLGATYTYDHTLSFTLGAEGTALWYRYQNQSFTTGKIGVTYGISYTF